MIDKIAQSTNEKVDELLEVEEKSGRGAIECFSLADSETFGLAIRLNNKCSKEKEYDFNNHSDP